ncbi:MAG: thioredoxin fold domain-containing protein [Cocleimonas sp.]
MPAKILSASTILNMKLSMVFSLVMALMLVSLPITQAHAESPKAVGKVLGVSSFDREMPDYFKDSFLDFREDAEEAGDAGKHMLVFADLKGCPYCAKMLKDNFETTEKEGGNREYIKTNFDSIHLNIKGSRDIAFNEETEVPENELAQALQVRFTPTLLFMNANNKVVARVNGYRSPREFKQMLNFVHEKAYEKTDFPSYREAHLKDSVYTFLEHEYLTEMTDFQKGMNADKPLAIIFEDKTCDECERFHKEVLDLPETKAILSKFNFVRLDALSDKEIIDPKGDKTTASAWLKRENISYRPAMLFYAEGKKIEELTGLLKSFHFQQLISFIANKKYNQYSRWTDYGEEYSGAILQSGKDIDIWK